MRTKLLTIASVLALVASVHSGKIDNLFDEASEDDSSSLQYVYLDKVVDQIMNELKHSETKVNVKQLLAVNVDQIVQKIISVVAGTSPTRELARNHPIELPNREDIYELVSEAWFEPCDDYLNKYKKALDFAEKNEQVPKAPTNVLRFVTANYCLKSLDAVTELVDQVCLALQCKESLEIRLFRSEEASHVQQTALIDLIKQLVEKIPEHKSEVAPKESLESLAGRV